MKKFLSLVLALVMTMSLVTVSAGAKDFTDDDQITYDEAVAVISALGIVDGYEDGDFKPTNSLTRGAAAKIICNLILGPTTADALSADSAPFSDVPANSTFAGYITYCSQQGIISGYADGTFRPGNTLTGYAFMKMLLGALGYDATIEGYTGSNWSVQVAKQALGIDLDDGHVGSFNGTQAVTREEACLYAFNTLEATMVEYDSKTSVNVSGVEVQVGGSEAKDVDQAGYKSYIVGGDDDKDDTLQFCERYFEDLKKDETNDDFGRPANTWKIKSTEIGTYVDSSDLVETWTAKVTKAKLYDAIGKTVVDDLEDGDSDMTYWFDGEETAVSKNDIADFADKNNTAKINDDTDTGNGSLTEVYVDDDNNVTLVVINTYVFQATEDYSSSRDSVKVAAAGDTDISLDDYELDGDDFDIEDVKEDDYLLLNVTKLSSSGNKYEVQIVTAAETVSGEIDSYSVEDTVTVDGTEYEYSVTTKDDGGVQSEIQSTGGTTTLVLDQYGYVIAVDDTILSGNYVFITDTETNLNKSVKAYAYFTDGTEGEINLKKVAGSTSTADMAAASGWYTYSEDSNGRYTLTEVKGSYRTVDNLTSGEATVKTAGAILYNGRAKLEDIGDVTGIRANEKTVFVIVDDDGDVDVYTGVSNAPDIEIFSGNDIAYTMGYVYKNSDKYATYVFIDVEDCSAYVDSSSEDDTFIFLTKDDASKDDGSETYEVYKAVVDGAEVSVETEDASYDVMKLYTKVKTDTSTERITSMKEVAVDEIDETYVKIDMTNETVTYSNGVLTIGSKSFIVNSDSQLNLILNYSRGIASSDRDRTVQDIMTDSGAAHEVHGSISGSSLKSTLSGYTVSGYYYIVVEDDYDDGDGNTTLDYLFMCVNGATPTNADEDDDVTPPVNTDIDVTISGTKITVDNADDADVDEIANAIVAELDSKGYTGISVSLNKDGEVEAVTATKGVVSYDFDVTVVTSDDDSDTTEGGTTEGGTTEGGTTEGGTTEGGTTEGGNAEGGTTEGGTTEGGTTEGGNA